MTPLGGCFLRNRICKVTGFVSYKWMLSQGCAAVLQTQNLCFLDSCYHSWLHIWKARNFGGWQAWWSEGRRGRKSRARRGGACYSPREGDFNCMGINIVNVVPLIATAVNRSFHFSLISRGEDNVTKHIRAVLKVHSPLSCLWQVVPACWHKGIQHRGSPCRCQHFPSPLKGPSVKYFSFLQRR